MRRGDVLCSWVSSFLAGVCSLTVLVGSAETEDASAFPDTAVDLRHTGQANK